MNKCQRLQKKLWKSQEAQIIQSNHFEKLHAQDQEKIDRLQDAFEILNTQRRLKRPESDRDDLTRSLMQKEKEHLPEFFESILKPF